MRYAARIDNTSAGIVQALRQVGAKVIHIRWPFDLLVLFRGRLVMIDCKTPRSKAGSVRKQASQVQLEAEGWPLRYVRSADEALRLIGVGL